MQNVQVLEIKQIQIKISMTPEQWDPRAFAVADTTRWHKTRLLNERVAKFAPGMGMVEFHTNLSRFANEIGYGDPGVIVSLVEYLYGTSLEQQVA